VWSSIASPSDRQRTGLIVLATDNLEEALALDLGNLELAGAGLTRTVTTLDKELVSVLSGLAAHHILTARVPAPQGEPP